MSSTKEAVLTTTHAGIVWTLRKLDDDGDKQPESTYFGLESDVVEYKALIRQEGTWTWISAIGAPPYYNDKRWRRAPNAYDGMSLHDAAVKAAETVTAIFTSMRYDDPTVAGDPAEAKLPPRMRAKLAQLRQLLIDTEQQVQDIRDELYGLSTGDIEADTLIVLPGLTDRSLPNGTRIRFHTPEGEIDAKYNGVHLVLTVREGGLVIEPVSASRVTLRAVRH